MTSGRRNAAVLHSSGGQGKLGDSTERGMGTEALWAFNRLTVSTYSSTYASSLIHNLHAN